MTFVPRQLIDLAVHFAVRQVAKYTTTIDWSKVKADLDVRVRDLIPGEFMDELSVALLNKVIDVIAAFLKDEEAMNKLIDLLTEKKLNEAFVYLRSFVIRTLRI